ncbi:MAG: type 1 glutamine amidotransferase domain-containing protein [Psychrosphaera sp.]|nr:type 1 glutamine amidotransferase domain-containing protein [Psychrosphaera sp.]
MTHKILIVLTSHDKLGDTGNKTGFWLEEFAAPYYVFIDAGTEVTLASVAGGQPPLDPTSAMTDYQTPDTHRFDEDKTAQQALATTLKLADINAADFDAVFYPGGHGPLWDLTDNKDSITLIENFVQANKPIAAVCHATAAFLNVKDEAGQWLVKDKSVTGFSNSEEAAVQLTDIVPFLLEDELKARGANYTAKADWAPFVTVDDGIITGQNPASSGPVAVELLTALG